jgi:hypothetical protein
MRKIRELLRRLTGREVEEAKQAGEDPAKALSDERVLGGARRR